MDLQNKTLVITGAARGLGAAMAQRLAKSKAKEAMLLETASMRAAPSLVVSK